MGFMGQKGDEGSNKSVGNPRSLDKSSTVQEQGVKSAVEDVEGENENKVPNKERDFSHVENAEGKDDVDPEVTVHDVEGSYLIEKQQDKEFPEVGNGENAEPMEVSLRESEEVKVEDSTNLHEKSQDVFDTHESTGEVKTQAEETDEGSPLVQTELSSEHHNQMLHEVQAKESHEAHSQVSSEPHPAVISDDQDGAAIINPSNSDPEGITKIEMYHKSSPPSVHSTDKGHGTNPNSVSQENDAIEKPTGHDGRVNEGQLGNREQSFSPTSNLSDSSDTMLELEKVKKEMKMMETALQGAARQAQAKADEIAKLMNENKHLKSVVEDLKRKSNDAEIESLREEYHQRVANLERKAYALTKERDMLRREQSKKSDAAALLKEKDEIITQVMAEGEKLSKKQVTQESTIRKLRAQIRELEEEKKGLAAKLQVEESKVESLKKDKTATEQLLQDTLEKHQSELAAQKEYYTTALAAAKEAEALAESRANNEARSELESYFREAEEHESMLARVLDELRQTLTGKEQQAVFSENMLRRDIEDLQKRYQASERCCEELITQVPESTRPLLRQIEAMQETAARRAEAWSAMERSLNS